MTKRTYSFGGGSADGSASMKNLLGGKGANLAEMSSLGMPVPPGFTLTTDVCMEYLASLGPHVPLTDTADGPLPDDLMAEVQTALAIVERILEKKFGDADDPLLLSVRSGGRVSMPGMMDTVLNLGLNDTTVQGLARGGGERFAWDSYRRFVTMYSDVVLGLHRNQLEALVDEIKESRGVTGDTDLTADDWRLAVQRMKVRVQESLGRPFPEDPTDQLTEAIKAVFRSWNTARARYYRKQNNIADDWGTAVNVQAMVFGNMGEDCATGVAFTRDPKDGKKVFFGEYLVNAQGEDVVAGTRTPQPLNRVAGQESVEGGTLEEVMPAAYAELDAVQKRLETHYHDMQDLEFTIENGRLFLLQTRTGKRTGAAAVRIAVDMANEGLIDRSEALLRVHEDHINQLLHPSVDPMADKTIIARGLPASPGAATGMVAFTAADAVEMVEAGHTVILVREETSPEDIEGMSVSAGILTQRGGQTSHAAVVARGMGRTCVVGCNEISVRGNDTFTARASNPDGGWTISKGDVITLDGGTGDVMLGDVDKAEADLESSGLDSVLAWADEVARLGVRANADTPHDAATARGFGAKGIGLCRTEHMFFEGDRITSVREMILAESDEEQARALDKLYPMQRSDFVGIFEAMDGLPVTIRLLDPPLHEFLPHEEADMQAVADAMGVPVERIREQAEALKEFNPMMGHRGCRLGITHPALYRMQVRAILDAALDARANGKTVLAEIMIPLVGVDRELEILRALVDDEAAAVFERRGTSIDFLIGTMIELPRACLTADKIAEHADFFSFGTNDLTQTTYGYSRDDARFLQAYVDPSVNVMAVDPFVSIDPDGVGVLVRTGTELGRKTKPNLKVGICGEHGGEPKSIAFVHAAGLDYVSCSPFRVPIARLSVAQATLLD